MKKNISKIKIIFLLSVFFIFLEMLGASAAWGPLSDYNDLSKNSKNMGDAAGLDTGISSGAGVGQIAELVIEGFLSLLGVIFITLMILAGYNWMSAAGDEQKITKAKDTILRAIIGLIITVSAFAISYFVFKNMPAGGETQPYQYTN